MKWEEGLSAGRKSLPETAAGRALADLLKWEGALWTRATAAPVRSGRFPEAAGPSAARIPPAAAAGRGSRDPLREWTAPSARLPFKLLLQGAAVPHRESAEAEATAAAAGLQAGGLRGEEAAGAAADRSAGKLKRRVDGLTEG